MFFGTPFTRRALHLQWVTPHTFPTDLLTEHQAAPAFIPLNSGGQLHFSSPQSYMTSSMAPPCPQGLSSAPHLLLLSPQGWAHRLGQTGTDWASRQEDARVGVPALQPSQPRAVAFRRADAAA